MAHDNWQVFLEVHEGARQQGPGSDETTERALRALGSLPASPHIVDMGSGTGRQTLALARRVPDARLTTVDAWPGFVKVLEQRVAAAGLADRVSARVASMIDPGEIEPPADLIWSEGAIYNVGVEAGLETFHGWLADGGGVAFSEVSWLVDLEAVPDEPRDFWLGEYPGIATVEQNLERIQRAGFEPLDHFVLPLSDWANYYDSLDEEQAKLASKYADDPEALATLGSHAMERDLLKRFSDAYNYVFYVARKAGS